MQCDSSFLKSSCGVTPLWSPPVLWPLHSEVFRWCDSSFLKSSCGVTPPFWTPHVAWLSSEVLLWCDPSILKSSCSMTPFWSAHTLWLLLSSLFYLCALINQWGFSSIYPLLNFCYTIAFTWNAIPLAPFQLIPKHPSNAVGITAQGNCSTSLRPNTSSPELIEP